MRHFIEKFHRNKYIPSVSAEIAFKSHSIRLDRSDLVCLSFGINSSLNYIDERVLPISSWRIYKLLRNCARIENLIGILIYLTFRN